MKRYVSLSIFLLTFSLLSGCASRQNQNMQIESQEAEKPQTNDTQKNDTQISGAQKNIPTEENSSAAITSDEAAEKAISHAGFSKDQVTVVKNKLDHEDGRTVYEIEFYAGENQEYDYEIDAGTGEILSFDYDAKQDTAQTNAEKSVPVTAEEARKLALAKVPGASDGDIFEFETDHDDGRTEYEGKIIFEGMEYEFEIDAANGSFLSWEAEKID